MRAWTFEAFGGPLVCRERPDPEPGPGEVVVDIDAVSLNYRDLLVLRGAYDPRIPRPAVPCSDAAGTVRAVGPGVRLAVGTSVVTLFAHGWIDGPPTTASLRSTLAPPGPGVLAERVVLPAAAVVEAPTVDPVEACTFPCAALTAWNALFEADSVGPGSTVLVLGTGGVSVFAAQFACAVGAKVMMTTSRSDKVERCLALGATATVRYDLDPTWGRTARAWAGAGVDHVVEVGGVGTLEQSLQAVRPGGTLSLIGLLAGSRAPVDLTPALMRSVRIQGVFVGSVRMFERMAVFVRGRALRPSVDLVVPFSDAPKAFDALAAGHVFGKVVIRVTG